MVSEAVKRVATFRAHDFATYEDRSKNTSSANNLGAGS
jgi:hypothetical protein